MTTEQRIMMRLESLRLTPIVKAKRIWVRGMLAFKRRADLKQMGFQYTPNDGGAWYWERQEPKPLYRANKRRAKKYQHELTDKSSK